MSGPVGSSQEAPISVSEPRRARVVVVRRRRAHSRPGPAQWAARRSRRRIIRVVVLCAGVLLLMAIGLCFGLARGDMAPAQSKLHRPSLAVLGARG